MELNLVRTVAVYAIPVIFAITLHEAAHGYVARYFGDQTAWRAGRVSLNPLRHIDLLGTILVPLGLLALGKLMGTGAILFGWAKPVPVNFHALRKPKQDMFWVAAAGPLANLAMALVSALGLKIATSVSDSTFLMLMLEAGIAVNIVLMVLNLLPILPLDGGRIAVSLLPLRIARWYARSEPFGFPILLLLIFTNVLGAILTPMVHASIGLIETLFQL